MDDSTNTIWTMLRSTVRGMDSPRQLALGITFGMLVGLVPKDSLFSYVFAVFLILSTANLLCGMLSGIFFSFVEAFLDPLTHSVGAWVLGQDSLQATWIWLYQLPLVGWTRFENTVVMGSVVVALALAVPTYRVSHGFFLRHSERIQDTLIGNHFVQWLIGRPTQLQKEG